MMLSFNRFCYLFICCLALLISSGVEAAMDCAAQTDIPQAECQALVNLYYNSTGGSNWLNTDFGNVPLDTSVSKTFTINNLISETFFPVESWCSSFGVTTSTTSPVAPSGSTTVLSPMSPVAPSGGTTTLTITYTPTVDGREECPIIISNNDNYETLYYFIVSGTGIPVSLNLTLATVGTGTVSSSGTPTGTTCGTGCLTYPKGTLVTLNTTPGAGSTFNHWSCIPAFNSGDALMANTTCTATFNAVYNSSPTFTAANPQCH